MPSVSGSTRLTTGFDEPVLSFVEGLRTNGWHIEGLRVSGKGWMIFHFYCEAQYLLSLGCAGHEGYHDILYVAVRHCGYRKSIALRLFP